MVWISIAVYLVVQMFDIKKSGLILLVAGIFVANPTVYALTATYVHDLDADMFAMLLSVVSALLWMKAVQNEKKKEKCILIVAASIILSIAMGIYQSYISLTVVLIMMISIKNLFENKKFSEVMNQGSQGIIVTVAGAGLYLLEVKIFSILTGISPMEEETYNSLGNMTHILEGNLFEKVFMTYWNCFGAFRKLIYSTYPELISLIIHIFLVICIIVIVLWGLKTIEWKSKVLVVILGILMPFAMNVSHFINNGSGHNALCCLDGLFIGTDTC